MSNKNTEVIYKEEFNNSLNLQKRLRESWLKSSSSWNDELFQYADPDFYFYRFIINRQERNTSTVLTNILFRLMDQYKIDYIPAKSKSSPFPFTITTNNIKVGYRFSDFFYDDDIEAILQENNVKKAIIIRTLKPEYSTKSISRDNSRYKEDKLPINVINLEDFFNQFFGNNEYNIFLQHLKNYLDKIKNITGYKSIKFLSSMNLSSQKLIEEKFLLEWQYKDYRYQIINPQNPKMAKYLSLSNFSFFNIEDMEKNFIKNCIYKTLLGTNEYAESFTTSEWLYSSLKGKENFDYTSIISGYLKSIEQLLNMIVGLNIDNDCYISLSNEKKIRKKAQKNSIIFYDINEQNEITEIKKPFGYTYIDFTTKQIEYKDSSIGTFEYFIRKNPKILIEESLSEPIADMVSCFRAECRNGYFHTHNLNDWKIVEKTRNNAIYLYFVLLGSCIIPECKKTDLGILACDSFDKLCIKIREFRHYAPHFIFEYDDGINYKLIYDYKSNTMEFDENGFEHYVSLAFYKVKDFPLETYQKLDENKNYSNVIFLTRENIPNKIIGIFRDGKCEEIL